MKYTSILLLLFFLYSCENDPREILNEGIETQDIEKIKSALRALPDVNIAFEDGRTLLGKAIKTDNIKIVELLLDKGATINPMKGEPPLFLASSSQMVALCLEKGAAVNAVDSLGNGLLHLSQELSIMKVLLDHNAFVSQRNNQGETPLMKAASSGNRELLMLLLEHGADETIQDKEGKSFVGHLLPNSDAAMYWQVEQERKAREAEQKKKEAAERKRKEALKNRFPAKGKIGYICNHGTLCQVLIKDVAGDKVKVEVLEKCWPRNMTTANLSKALDAGNVCWLGKYRISRKKGDCL